MKIAVVGAGLMGRLLAWQLSRQNHEINLFERDFSGMRSAAYAAGGLLTPLAELDYGNRIIFQLGMHSLTLWPHLLNQLSQSVWFQQKGSITLAHPSDADLLNQFIYKRRLPDTQTLIEPLALQSLYELEPELTFNQAYWLKPEGVLDTRQLLQAVYLELISSDNVQLHQKEIKQTEEYYITEVSGKREHFDLVIDCRGIGDTNRKLSLRPVRGELIYLSAPDVTLHRPIRLIHPRYPVYVVPRENSTYLIGASEIEAFDESPISVRTCLELLSGAYSIHSGFGEARIIETVTALRPALADNLPKIIPSPGRLVINGLFRHGFLIAPALIELILIHINQQPIPLDYQSIFSNKETK